MTILRLSPNSNYHKKQTKAAKQDNIHDSIVEELTAMSRFNMLQNSTSRCLNRLLNRESGDSPVKCHSKFLSSGILA